MVLLRVALAFLLLLLLPDLYIYRLYVAACRSRLKYLYWLPSLVLLLGLGGFLLAAESGHTAFGTYLVALLCVTVPKVLFVVSDVLLRLCGLRSARSLRIRSVTTLSVAGLGLGYLLYGALWGKEDFRVRQVTFTSPDLPAAFDGYRLLQLSDI
ncbi:MAG: metallophosphoesterase, partial [Bacteroidales bacterium]|nr:metallophosphoesterase [Bacteroidales bacterium]